MVILKRLVLAHNGEAIVKNFKELQFPELDYHRKPNVKAVKDMRIDPFMNTIIMLHHGSLLIRDCLFTLRSLPKDLTRKVPCLVALPKTHLCIINSEFVGCSGNLTAAIVSINATSCVISASRFQRFRGGAVYSIGHGGDPARGKKPSEFLM